jgi:hypothetical protein
LSETTIAFLDETRRRFGAPAVITLKRNSLVGAGAEGEGQ